MMLYRLLFSFTCLFVALSVQSQCFSDRHNTNRDQAWLSCTSSQSPNPERGESHWIMYDLGNPQELGGSTIWNYNTPDQESNGIQELIVDYSFDGITWETYGSHTLQSVKASSFYEGDIGPDLTGINAQYILLTAGSNYGGDCYGLAEIKIEVGEIVSSIVENEIKGFSFNPSPNPASDVLVLKFESDFNFDGSLIITNSLGQQVYTEEVSFIAGYTSSRLDVQAFVPGIYLISIHYKNTFSTSELIITR